MSDPPTERLRLAYVVTRYPAVSHSFVLHEVAALRARGVDVHTFSIHRTADEDLLTADDLTEASRTYAVLPPRWAELLGAHLRGATTRASTYMRVLVRALRVPAVGRRGRRARLAHFVEAVAIWRRCEERGISHVHAHFTSPSADVAMLVALLLARGNQEAASWSFTAHGTDVLADLPERLGEKVRSASLVVCVSDFGRSQLMRLVDEAEWDKLRIIRCGLTSEWLGLTRDGQEPGDRPFRLLSVGRLEREKGHALLLEAIAQSSVRDVTLNLIGDGSRQEALRKLAADLEIADRIEFSGKVGQDSLPQCYAAADAFCLPSLGEGIPVVLMEAMAAGLPVIAPRLMGIPELIEHGNTGLLVTPGRPDSFASAIEQLARDPDLRRRLGEAARRKVASEHDLERAADQLVRAFASLPAARIDATP